MSSGPSFAPGRADAASALRSTTRRMPISWTWGPASWNRGRTATMGTAFCWRAVSGRLVRARSFGSTVAAADLSSFGDLLATRGAEGCELVSLAAVTDRPEELYRLDAAALADVPTTYSEDDIRLEDWLTEVLGHPQLSHEGSYVVLAGGTPAAYAFLHVDTAGRVAANDMTGTHPDHRRGGLAKLAKLGTIAWARERGYETIYTDTDQENAGMLHLNRSLGYRSVGTETQYLREDLR